jgi:hypothetical protein
MTLTFTKFKDQLTPTQLEKLLVHFYGIYECTVLSEHEFKICYLAYLWKNKELVLNEFGYEIPNASALGIDVFKDYEITFEDEDPGGVNLGVLHDYYIFQTL